MTVNPAINIPGYRFQGFFTGLVPCLVTDLGNRSLMMVVINCFYSLSPSLPSFLPAPRGSFTRNVYSSPHGKFLTEKKITSVGKPKMSSQNQRFHCLAENERFAILSLKFLVWSQNSFAFCPKSAVKIPNFSGRQTLVFTSTREKLQT